MLHRIINIILLTLLMYINIHAQNTKQSIYLQRLEGHITLDGKVNEKAWEKIDPLPLVTHWPEFGNAPSDPTQLRIAYDDNYIYFSGICLAAKENILAASFKRDLFSLGTDYISLTLDTFNDNENALSFSTTPTGSRADQAISEDANRTSGSWDTFWESEAKIFENGWSAEMRIPISSLGFQEVDGKVMMGMLAWRYTAKKNEMDIFPAVPPNWGFWSFVKPSAMQKVVLEGIKSNNPVYITPYLLGGLGRQNVLNSSETAYKKQNDITRNIGLDVKYNVTNNLTLDFSLNTDFAQVEADDQQVNLTRFSLFFPEKRRFFLERASIFDFRFGGSSRLFYTRRIGLKEGQPVNIIGGGRLSGRIGSWDVGVLNVQTEGGSGLPSENFGVLRLRKQVLNNYSFLGGMTTSRVNANGDYNLAYGLDGVLRLFGDDYFSFNAAQSYVDTARASHDFINSSRARILWERRSYANFAYKLSLETSGKDYNPAVGFEFRKNFAHLNNELSYGKLFKGNPLFQRYRFSINTDIYSRNEDNSIETIEISPEWQGASINGSSFSLGFKAVRENLLDGFSIGDEISIPAGEHTFYDFSASYDTPGGEELSASIYASNGTFYDGKRFSAGISQKWIVSKYFELNGSYDFDLLEFSQRSEILRSHVVRIRTLLALNTKISLAAFIQYSSTAKLSLANLRFRFNPSEGHDLYIVYNEQFNTDRRRELPQLPLSNNRAILAKYTYTFIY